MRVQDLVIDPKSLGSKFWLTDVAPVHEYRDNKLLKPAPNGRTLPEQVARE